VGIISTVRERQAGHWIVELADSVMTKI